MFLYTDLCEIAWRNWGVEESWRPGLCATERCMKSFAHHKIDGKGKRKAKGLHDNILNPYNLHLPKYKTNCAYKLCFCFVLNWQIVA